MLDDICFMARCLIDHRLVCEQRDGVSDEEKEDVRMKTPAWQKTPVWNHGQSCCGKKPKPKIQGVQGQRLACSPYKRSITLATQCVTAIIHSFVS